MVEVFCRRTPAALFRLQNFEWLCVDENFPSSRRRKGSSAKEKAEEKLFLSEGISRADLEMTKWE